MHSERTLNSRNERHDTKSVWASTRKYNVFIAVQKDMNNFVRHAARHWYQYPLKVCVVFIYFFYYIICIMWMKWHFLIRFNLHMEIEYHFSAFHMISISFA